MGARNKDGKPKKIQDIDNRFVPITNNRISKQFKHDDGRAAVAAMRQTGGKDLEGCGVLDAQVDRKTLV